MLAKFGFSGEDKEARFKLHHTKYTEKGGVALSADTAEKRVTFSPPRMMWGAMPAKVFILRVAPQKEGTMRVGSLLGEERLMARLAFVVTIPDGKPDDPNPFSGAWIYRPKHNPFAPSERALEESIILFSSPFSYSWERWKGGAPQLQAGLKEDVIREQEERDVQVGLYFEPLARRLGAAIDRFARAITRHASPKP